jgi:hypothetical protein
MVVEIPLPPAAPTVQLVKRLPRSSVCLMAATISPSTIPMETVSAVLMVMAPTASQMTRATPLLPVVLLPPPKQPTSA